MTFKPSPNREAEHVPLADNARAELCNLIDLLLEEQLDEGSHDRLAQLIASSEEAQSIYVSEMNRHAALAWQWGAFGGQEADIGDQGGAWEFPQSPNISGQWPVASGQKVESGEWRVENELLYPASPDSRIPASRSPNP